MSSSPDDDGSTIVILGDAFADLQCFLDGDFPREAGGDTRLSQTITTVAGGSGLNTATHLRAIAAEDNMNVTLYTAINGSDSYGKLLCKHANQHGISLINCCSSGGSTGHCAVMVANGERSFLTHLGVMEAFQAKDIPIDSIIERAAPKRVHIHVAGYYNIPGFWGPDQLFQLLSRLKSALPRIVVSVLPQYDATEAWNGQLLELLPFVDYLFLNKLEAQHIVEARSNNDIRVEELEQEDFLKTIAKFFNKYSPKTSIVMTLGANGACILKEGKIIAQQPAPLLLENPLDPTGAGDAFIAGFLYGIHSSITPSLDNSRGLLYGCVLGTACVMRSGASNPAPKKEINEMLKKI